MLGPAESHTHLGRARQTVFVPPYVLSDWVKMAELISDADVNGMALRFIADDRVRVVVTTTNGDSE